MFKTKERESVLRSRTDAICVNPKFTQHLEPSIIELLAVDNTVDSGRRNELRTINTGAVGTIKGSTAQFWAIGIDEGIGLGVNHNAVFDGSIPPIYV